MRPDSDTVQNRIQAEPNSALVIYRPLVEKILAALGALVTHQLAYLLASQVGREAGPWSDHGHIAFQWAVVVPVAAVAVAGLVVVQLKWLGFRSRISARQLGLLVTAFFLAQEAIEGLTGGHAISQMAAHPAIVAGLLIGPIVGWFMSRALAGVTELVGRLLARPGLDRRPAPSRSTSIPPRIPSTLLRSPSRPRAPPSLLRI